jgi:hypothetical protein
MDWAETMSHQPDFQRMGKQRLKWGLQPLSSLALWLCPWRLPHSTQSLFLITGMMRAVTSVVDATFKPSYIFIYYNMSLLLWYSVFVVFRVAVSTWLNTYL